MLDFWEGRYDVLVCTTIIESGIDMPTVNTLVILRADMLGLGQLHQLRGRVGRAGQILIPVPFVAFAVRYFGQIIHRLSEQIQAALGVLSTRAQENLTGVRVIRAYAQEKPQIASFDEANRDYVDHNIKLIGSWSLFFPARRP